MVTATSIPPLELETVAEAIAEICAAVICSTVLPLTVRELALTFVTEKVAVLVTLRFVKVPVVALTALLLTSMMLAKSSTLLTRASHPETFAL